MRKFTLKEAAMAVNGKLNNADENAVVESVVSDSRLVEKGCLFAALKGEFFDGHNFAAAAANSGAVCVLSHVDLGSEVPHILVKDTKYAFMDLAKWYLEQFKIPVVAITGSVGKTTTKDMLAAVLSEKFNVVKNEGNYNNEIGLPLTVFNIDDEAEIAVLEMGMNSFGEIHNLSRIATPEVCVITNIGNAHIGNLGSREGILKAKSEIFDFADKNVVAILNSDDDMLKNLYYKSARNLFFGTDESAYCRSRKIDDLGLKGSIWRVYVDGSNFLLTIPLPGDYLIYNAMAAICAGKYYGIENEKIASAIKNFKPSKNRMDIFEINGITIVNDVYNASPVSMQAMIGSMAHSEGRKICVFGDMLELGEGSAAYHEEIGAYAAENNVDAVFVTGEFAGCYEKGFKVNGSKTCFLFNDAKELTQELIKYIKEGDTVLVKASRGMKFEQIIDELKRCL
ncbi:UDP-N-acetylmuramoyl-tripeptide--D-alanyl-D-alanine ligase [Tyzzerella sp. OttesenSCG-928-J15]|nr:UDP-N-acetylmuramoyl-tripeptide--D-alanyl-D-alanine ligase [Tyzzerella sp. OttesenSCG-928-J15]